MNDCGCVVDVTADAVSVSDVSLPIEATTPVVPSGSEIIDPTLRLVVNVVPIPVTTELPEVVEIVPSIGVDVGGGVVGGIPTIGSVDASTRSNGCIEYQPIFVPKSNG